MYKNALTTVVNTRPWWRCGEMIEYWPGPLQDTGLSQNKQSNLEPSQKRSFHHIADKRSLLLLCHCCHLAGMRNSCLFTNRETLGYNLTCPQSTTADKTYKLSISPKSRFFNRKLRHYARKSTVCNCFVAAVMLSMNKPVLCDDGRIQKMPKYYTHTHTQP